MSRLALNISRTTTVISGSDCALGRFYDIVDSRFAQSGNDFQGEGYLVEYNQLFGFSQNRIGITFEQLKDVESIKRLIDIFVENGCPVSDEEKRLLDEHRLENEIYGDL